jgi:hypothetical protein
MLNLNIIRLIGRLLSQRPFLKRLIKNAEPGAAGNTIFFRLFSAGTRRSGPEGGEGVEPPRDFDFRLFGKKWRCTGEGHQKNSPASLQGRPGSGQDKPDLEEKKHGGLKIAVDRIRFSGKAGRRVLTPSGDFETARAGKEGG